MTTPNKPAAANLAVTLWCYAVSQRREVAGRDRSLKATCRRH
jgi:hypothetical protein